MSQIITILKKELLSVNLFNDRKSTLVKSMSGHIFRSLFLKLIFFIRMLKCRLIGAVIVTLTDKWGMINEK